jgi:DNA-binding transcriptional LysR family regulator
MDLDAVRTFVAVADAGQFQEEQRCMPSRRY